MANGFLLKPHDMTLVTCGTVADGYRAKNINDDRFDLRWKSAAGSATQSLTIDLGADKAIDTITLHGLLNAQAAWQLTVELATEVQGKFTGSYWSDSAQDLLAGSRIPWNNECRGLWQAPSGAPASARYVRLAFSALSSAAITVSRVMIGQRMQLTHNFTYGAARGTRPLGEVRFNNRGTPIRRSGKTLRGVGVTLAMATREEAETEIQPFLDEVGNAKAVAIVVEPDAGANLQEHIYYGFLTGDLGTIWAGYNRFTSSFNVVAMD